ncbi:MAG: HlyD family secretion protein [Chthoniobacteraceae bacterium]
MNQEPAPANPADEKKTGDQPAPPPVAQSVTPVVKQPAPARRRGILLVLGIAAIVLILFKGIPWVISIFNTISTDDAYVNGHVTFVAPRVSGQVMKVLVDDNNRVRKGDVIVQLDKEPYLVQVDLKQAAVDTAKADLVAAGASVRSMVAQTRGSRFKLEHAIEDVDNQVATIRTNVAAMDKAKATLTLAQAEFERAKKLIETKVTSHEEFDQRQEALDVAQAQYSQSLETVYQSRVALGLPAKPEGTDDLTQVPPDLGQTFSSVREALAQLMQNASQLNIIPSSYDLSPKQMLAEFYKRDPGGNIDRIYDEIIKNAPPMKQAQAKLKSAEADLAQAQLDLRYCDIISDIDGVVTRRNVNPGNNVQAGQSLMAVRSLREIWVDANFKETQIANLRIGQPVDLETDLYGSKKIFKGRISGFTMGTGSTLALLPAQNATGNFVKVVQRLPVRIDVIDYDPDKEPLFTGISVTPVVHFKETPTGPDAGTFLQPDIAPAVTDSTPTPAPAKQ